MEPPLPPSPPSGPPRGMNFSRRKLIAPRPPWPAVTSMSTSSTNMGGCWNGGGRSVHEDRAPSRRRGGDVAQPAVDVTNGRSRHHACVREPPLRFGLGDLGGDDADEPSARPVIFELYAAADLRE